MAKNNQQAAPAAESVQVALYGTDALPARVILIEGATVALGDVVRRAAQDAKLSAEAWNELAQSDRDAAILTARDVLATEAKAAVDKGDVVECAVLFDSSYGKHDDIVLMPPEQAKAVAAAGFVDHHPNAVKAIRDARAGKEGA
jgi:hypothetical protein